MNLDRFTRLIGASCGVVLALGTAASAQNWQAGAPPEWQKVMEAAKKEGAVVVAGSPEFGKPLTEAYERDTGLKMDFLGGPYNELDARFSREARAGNATIDVHFSGGNAINALREGIVEPIKPLLILPTVTDGKNWRDGKIKWQDKDEKGNIIPNEYILGWPLFDGNVIKPGMIESWKDLLKPEWKGKIAAYDPSTPGPGLAIGTFLADRFGMDYVKKLYIDQDVKLTRNPRQLVEWVARGTYPIALSALATHIETFKKEGVTNLVVPEIKDGPGTILGGSSLPTTPKKTPHPNARIVFLNWYLSQPGQQIFAETWATPSRRIDVSVPSIPEYVIPKPGRDYLDQYAEDFYVNIRTKIGTELTKLIGR